MGKRACVFFVVLFWALVTISSLPTNTSTDEMFAGKEIESTLRIKRKEAFEVSIDENDSLQVKFVEKVKEYNKGWAIKIQFSNKSKKGVKTLSTLCHLYEGDWRILSWRIQRSGMPILMKAEEKTTITWIKGVASSIDRLHLEILNLGLEQ